MKAEIVEYGIAGADNAAGLSKIVGDAINDGWEPFGGVAVGSVLVTLKNKLGDTKEAEQCFFQAVIKRKKLIRTLQ